MASEHRLFSIETSPPWLTVVLPVPHRILSWALNAPGYVTAQKVVWREVRNADLPADLDAEVWLRKELDKAGLFGTPAMVTSRELEHVLVRQATVEDVVVEVVATVGLSNAERVGARRAPLVFPVGTINLAVVVSPGLSDGAMLEAVSIATEARTAAVIDHGPMIETGRATGTGTDCIAVAAPQGSLRYAGLHTALGEAIGHSVYDAVSAGVRNWMRV
ncbi:MAG: adenosylcobinamide amidohydrolase [Pseudomonadota bacterium]